MDKVCRYYFLVYHRHRSSQPYWIMVWSVEVTLLIQILLFSSVRAQAKQSHQSLNALQYAHWYTIA